MNVTGLRCVRCGAHYEEGAVEYTCPPCGIEGILDVEYDYERVQWAPSAERSIWRYLPLLPVRGHLGVPSLQVGWTPVAEFPKLAARLGVGAFLVKDDGRLPTGSFKDRASAVGTVKARERGRDIVACSSTGNAASSLAGFCANQGLRAIIFVPASAPEAKIAQLRAFGARVLLVEGSYDQAYYLCQQAVAEFGWYNRNCAVNPYLVEGKKTCGLEIGEQLAEAPPDVVAVAVGDGCTVAGIWKGLFEMHRLGVLPRLPRLLGVQAAGAAPLVDAFSRGADESAGIRKVKAQTLADSIAVGEPRNWRKALRAVRASGGAWVAVSDEAILEASRDLAAATGIFAEPTGAAALAGIRAAREQGTIGARDRVLHVVTGSGLKDVRGAALRAPEPTRIGVALEDVRRAWQS
ncbi:MAG TPA: threonine synthase [Polyangia bacterium]|nr:threonine synthase [Polyangia bacterium]